MIVEESPPVAPRLHNKSDNRIVIPASSNKPELIHNPKTRLPTPAEPNERRLYSQRIPHLTATVSPLGRPTHLPLKPSSARVRRSRSMEIKNKHARKSNPTAAKQSLISRTRSLEHATPSPPDLLSFPILEYSSAESVISQASVRYDSGTTDSGLATSSSGSLQDNTLQTKKQSRHRMQLVADMDLISLGTPCREQVVDDAGHEVIC